MDGVPLYNGLKYMEGGRIRVNSFGSFAVQVDINNLEVTIEKYGNREFLILFDIGNIDEFEVRIAIDTIKHYNDDIYNEVCFYGNNGIDFLITKIS